MPVLPDEYGSFQGSESLTEDDSVPRVRAEPRRQRRRSPRTSSAGSPALGRPVPVGIVVAVFSRILCGYVNRCFF